MSLYDRSLADLVQAASEGIIGRRRELKNVLAALKVGRNILLEGPPGTSKSTILRQISHLDRVPLYMVEGSADLTPAKMIGTHNPALVLADGYNRANFEAGPFTKAMEEGGFLYLEEFNRVPEDVLNVLIRAMDDRRLTIPRIGEIAAQRSFRVIAAMNPYDDVGTEKISRAITDRLCRVALGYQSAEEEKSIVRRQTGCGEEWLIALAVELVRATRNHQEVKMGASVRGAIDMVLIAAELLSVLPPDAPEQEVEEELLQAALTALATKIWLYDISDKSPEQLVRELWAGARGVLRPLYLCREPKRELGPAGGGTLAPTGNAEGRDWERATLEEEAATSDGSGSRSGPEGGSLAGEDGTIYLGLASRPRRRRQSPAELRAAEERALRLALSLPRVGRPAPALKGAFRPAPFAFEADELDLERTMERLAGKQVVEYDDLVVRERQGLRWAYSLIMDISGSMAGGNALCAATAAATLANNMRQEEFAVVAFAERGFMVKTIEAAKPIRRIIRDIFTIEPAGRTDIAIGLALGLQELHRARSPRKIGILLTDGAHNKRGEPERLAAQFPILHVLAISPPLHTAKRRCESMAELGRGRCLFAHTPWQVAQALSSLFA